MKHFLAILLLVTLMFSICTLTVFATEEGEPNDQKANATSISLGTEVTGNISKSSDQDWFKFTTPKDGYITVAFKHEKISSLLQYWNIYIYQSDGVTTVSEGNEAWAVTGDANCETSQIGLKAGSYYIKIAPYNIYTINDVTYTLTVNFTESAQTEYEPNSNQKKATAIDVNKEYMGAIASVHDEDWFKFTLTAKAQITLNFCHELIESFLNYWNVYLYSADGATKLYEISVTGNSNGTFDVGDLAPGLYYVKITYCSLLSDVTYKLKVSEKHDCQGSWKTTSNATCDKNGLKEQICNICGRVIKTEAIPATGHKYGDWTIDRQPTCSVEGEKHASCSVCGATKNESISTLEHTYGEKKIIEEPTCDKIGKSQGICTVCGSVITEDVPKLVHEYTDWYVAKAATCTEDGTEMRECKLCGVTESQVLSAYTHQYGDWKVVGGNKIIPPIVKEKRCVLCNDTQVYRDWSYSWITVIVAVVFVGAIIGVVNYVKAFKKSKENKEIS